MATATLSDNDFANIEALSFTKRGYDSAHNWTVSTQFRVTESDAFDGKYGPLGIKLSSKPTSDVLLKLDESSFSRVLCLKTISLTFSSGIIYYFVSFTFFSTI